MIEHEQILKLFHLYTFHCICIWVLSSLLNNCQQLFARMARKNCACYVRVSLLTITSMLMVGHSSDNIESIVNACM